MTGCAASLLEGRQGKFLVVQIGRFFTEEVGSTADTGSSIEAPTISFPSIPSFRVTGDAVKVSQYGFAVGDLEGDGIAVALTLQAFGLGVDFWEEEVMFCAFAVDQSDGDHVTRLGMQHRVGYAVDISSHTDEDQLSVLYVGGLECIPFPRFPACFECRKPLKERRPVVIKTYLIWFISFSFGFDEQMVPEQVFRTSFISSV